MMPKKEMVRIVRNREGEINIDLKGKAPGRGAYICHNPDCVNKLSKHKLLEKTFEQKVSQDVYDKLLEQLKGESEEYQ